jgi:hypothetical protein
MVNMLTQYYDSRGKLITCRELITTSNDVKKVNHNQSVHTIPIEKLIILVLGSLSGLSLYYATVINLSNIP